jgi:cardiolipin synthase
VGDQPETGEQDERSEPSVGGPGVEGEDTSDLSRIWTVPNVISFVRLLGIPLFVYLMFPRDNLAAGAILLGILGSTDWVDGWYARRYHQVSNLGKALDPTVDRLVLIVGIVSAIVAIDEPWFRLFAALVLFRELAVACWTLLITAVNRGVSMEVTWWGKAGTFCMYFAFPFFIAGASTFRIAPLFDVLAWGFAIPGLVLSYWAAALYIPIGVKALREGRAARRAATDGDGASSAPALGKEH